MTKGMMKQWEVSAYHLESLRQAEVPIPEPTSHQILMKVGAVSLNFRDKLALDGEFGTHHPLPIIPASDAAGTVAGAGTSVRRFELGDRVTSTFAPRWLSGKYRIEEQSATLGFPLPGVLAEYILLDENGAVATPSYLSDVEASTLPIAAVTAWSALFERCDLKPGQTILVQGTGGVSLFALQLARAAGSNVIVTSSSDDKLARATELGASGTINYAKEPEWHVAARSLTDGKGVDHILDVAGGENIRRSLAAVRTGGNIVIVGLLQNPKFTLEILPFIFMQGAIHTLSVGSRDAFEAMNRALAINQIRPVIDREYSLDEVPQAFERLSQGPFGKIVIRVQA